MLFNAFPEVTTLISFLSLLSIYATDLTSARTINERQITQNEAEIRLGLDGNDFEFKRLTRSNNDAFENQLKRLLLLWKVNFIQISF